MKSSLQKVVTAALFCALAYICVFFFRFSGIGGFLTFDAKDAVMTIGSLFLGPVTGVATVFVVSLLEFFTINSGTGIYGLLMDVLSSTTFVLAASLVYKYRRNMKGAVIGLSSSVVLMTTVMLAANLLITPYYTHTDRAAVAAMIPTVLLPFNLTKAVFNAALVLLLYKPLSTTMRKAHLLPASVSGSAQHKTRSLVTVLVSLFLITVCVLVLLFCLGGNFEIFSFEA